MYMYKLILITYTHMYAHTHKRMYNKYQEYLPELKLLHAHHNNMELSERIHHTLPDKIFSTSPLSLWEQAVVPK